jgi:hypothetical protein
MELKSIFVLILAINFLTGCESVMTTQPMGETVVKLNPEQWEGTWKFPEGVGTTTVLDKDKGVLQASWIERREDGTGMEVVKGTVRATGDMTFFVARDEHQKELFHWARVKKGDNYLIMWSTNVEQFKILINDGKLSGKVTEGSVVLDELKPEDIQMIDDPSANLLKWKEPDIFVRIGD